MGSKLSPRRKIFSILVSWLYCVKLGVWGLAPRKAFMNKLSRMPENAPSQDRRDVKISVFRAILAPPAPPSVGVPACTDTFLIILRAFLIILRACYIHVLFMFSLQFILANYEILKTLLERKFHQKLRGFWH